MKKLICFLMFLIPFTYIKAEINITESGWHLVSPGGNINISDLLKNQPNIKSIWEWNKVTWKASFSTTISNNPYMGIQSLQAGKGYWIQTMGPVALSGTKGIAKTNFNDYRLESDIEWYLFGTSNEIDNIMTFFSDIPEKSTVWTWNNNNWAVYTKGDTGESNKFNEEWGTNFNNLRSISGEKGFWIFLPQKETDEVLPPSPDNTGQNGIYTWNSIKGVVYEKDIETDQIIPIANVSVTTSENDIDKAVFAKQGYITRIIEKTELKENSVVYMGREDKESILLEKLSTDRSLYRKVSDFLFGVSDLVLTSSKGIGRLHFSDLDKIPVSARMSVSVLSSSTSLPEPHLLGSNIIGGLGLTVRDSMGNTLSWDYIKNWDIKIEPMLTRFIGEYDGEDIKSLIDNGLGSLKLLYYDPEQKIWENGGNVSLEDLRTDPPSNFIGMIKDWGIHPESESSWLSKPYPYVIFTFDISAATRKVKVSVNSKKDSLPIEKAAVSFNDQKILVTNSNGQTEETTFVIPPSASFLLLEVVHPDYNKKIKSVLISELKDNETNSIRLSLSKTIGDVQILAKVHSSDTPVGNARVRLKTPSVLTSEKVRVLWDEESKTLQRISVGEANSTYTWSAKIPSLDDDVTLKVTPNDDGAAIGPVEIRKLIQDEGHLAGPVDLKIKVKHRIEFLGSTGYTENITDGKLVLGVKPEYIISESKNGDITLQGGYEDGFINAQAGNAQWKALVMWNDENHPKTKSECSTALSSYDYILKKTNNRLSWELANKCEISLDSYDDFINVFNQGEILTESPFLPRALIDHYINSLFIGMAAWIHNEKSDTDTRLQYAHDTNGVTILLMVKSEKNNQYAVKSLQIKIPKDVPIPDGVDVTAVYLPASFNLPEIIEQTSLDNYLQIDGKDYNVLFNGIPQSLDELLTIQAEKNGYRMEKGTDGWQQVGALTDTIKELSIPILPIPGPSNLTLTSENALLNASWSEVEGASTYKLYCSTNSGINNFDSTTYTIVNNINGVNISLSDLTSGNTYYCIVSALSAEGSESSGSSEQSVLISEPIPEETDTMTQTDTETVPYPGEQIGSEVIKEPTFFSTGSPYENDITVEHSMTIEDAESLIVTIIGDTEPTYDKLIVYDENLNNIGEYSGEIFESLIISGNSISVSFSSDSNVNLSGATVSIANNDGIENKTFTTGVYGNNMEINKTLFINDATDLLITINGEIEKDYDFLDIFDAEGNHIAQFNGIIDDNFSISGNSIVVRFTSDEIISPLTDPEAFLSKEGLTVNIESKTIENNTTFATGNPYENNANLSSILSILDAVILEVKVTGESEEGYDTLMIFDENGDLVQVFSGIVDETLEIPGSFIEVAFTSDGSYTMSGFNVEINEATISTENPVFSTGEYENYIYLSDTLMIPEAQNLNVNISGSTEEDCDILFIYDQNWNFIGEFSGSVEENLVVSGNRIYIEFGSDGSIVDDGITVTISEAGLLKNSFTTGSYGNNMDISDTLGISSASALLVTVKGESEYGYDFLSIPGVTAGGVKLTDQSLENLVYEGVSEDILEILEDLKNQEFTSVNAFFWALEENGLLENFENEEEYFSFMDMVLVYLDKPGYLLKDQSIEIISEELTYGYEGLFEENHITEILNILENIKNQEFDNDEELDTALENNGFWVLGLDYEQEDIVMQSIQFHSIKKPLSGVLDETFFVDTNSIEVRFSSDEIISPESDPDNFESLDGITVTIEDPSTSEVVFYTGSPYSPNSQLAKTLSIPGASALEVIVTGKTEENEDILHISDVNGNLPKTLSGTIDNSFVMPGSSINVEFISNDSYEIGSVLVRIKETENIITDKTYFTTGTYSKNTNISETLMISSADVITVNVNGETEQDYDFLRIYDSSENLLKEYSGIVDESFTVFDNSIFIEFVSDDFGSPDEETFLFQNTDGITVTIESGGSSQEKTTFTTGSPYEDNQDIFETLTIPGANALEVTINGITEECCDLVYIYDANGLPYGPYGGILDESIIIPGSLINVEFISDGSVNDEGVTVKIYEVEDAGTDTGTGSISQEKTIFSTDSPYENDQFLWDILTIPGANGLEISIYGYTEDNFDYVNIYDADYELYGSYSGAIEETLIFPGDSIIVEFISDNAVTDSGVTVEITEIEEIDTGTGTMVQDNAVFSTGSPYEDNQNLSESLYIFGAEALDIYITGKTEYSYDLIKIYSADGELYGTFSGDINENFILSGDTIEVVFISDGSVNDEGVTVEIYETEYMDTGTGTGTAIENIQSVVDFGSYDGDGILQLSFQIAISGVTSDFNTTTQVSFGGVNKLLEKNETLSNEYFPDGNGIVLTVNEFGLNPSDGFQTLNFTTEIPAGVDIEILNYGESLEPPVIYSLPGDYVYGSNVINEIISTISDWDSGTIINPVYSEDIAYNPCIKLQSGTGWGDVSAIAFTEMPEGIVSNYSSLKFKIKTTDYSTVRVKVPEVEKVYSIESGKYLGNGWTEMTIPLNDFDSVINNATQFAIFEFGAGAMYITDVYFKTDNNLEIFVRGNNKIWDSLIGNDSNEIFWEPVDVSTDGNLEHISSTNVSDQYGYENAAKQITFTGTGLAQFYFESGNDMDLSSYLEADGSLLFDVKVLTAPSADSNVFLEIRSGKNYMNVCKKNITDDLREAGSDWTTIGFSLKDCNNVKEENFSFSEIDVPLLILSDSQFSLVIANVIWGISNENRDYVYGSIVEKDLPLVLSDREFGTIIDPEYYGDTTYNPCIKLQSSTWGDILIAFTEMSNGFMSDYTNLKFKIKSIDYTEINIAVLEFESENNDYLELTYSITDGDYLENEWTEMTIPLSDFGSLPNSANEFAFLGYGTGTMYITDVYFEKSADVETNTEIDTDTGTFVEDNTIFNTSSPYEDSLNISKTLFITGAKGLEISISGKTESGYDFINIYDADGELYGSYSGSINENFILPGNSIEVVFTSDSSVNDEGVTVEIFEAEGVETNTGFDTGTGTFVEEKTIFSTGSPYEDDQEIMETLSISGAEALEVNISGKTEQEYDFIKIYNSEGVLYGPYSGSIDENLILSGDSIEVVFVSDGSVNDEGVTVEIFETENVGTNTGTDTGADNSQNVIDFGSNVGTGIFQLDFQIMISGVNSEFNTTTQVSFDGNDVTVEKNIELTSEYFPFGDGIVLSVSGFGFGFSDGFQTLNFTTPVPVGATVEILSYGIPLDPPVTFIVGENNNGYDTETDTDTGLGCNIDTSYEILGITINLDPPYPGDAYPSSPTNLEMLLGFLTWSNSEPWGDGGEIGYTVLECNTPGGNFTEIPYANSLTETTLFGVDDNYSYMVIAYQIVESFSEDSTTCKNFGTENRCYGGAEVINN